jgi:hypothetical protein
MRLRTKFDILISYFTNHKPDARARTPQTAYYNDFIQITGGGPGRDLFIYPIKNNKLDEINTSFCNILSVLNKFARYVIYQNPSLLNDLKLPYLNLESIKKRHSDYLFTYGRIDSIFNGSQFRVLEVNTKRPQLYEDSDWLSDYLYNLMSDSIIPEHTSHDIAESIKTGYQLNQNRLPEVIVLLSGFINFIKDKPYGSHFYSALRKTFPKSKIITISCREFNEFQNNLKLNKNSLFYHNQKIDLIIFQDLCGGKNKFMELGQIRNTKIRTAYESLNLEIFSQPSAWIIGNKLNLPLIQNSEIQSKLGLNQNEFESLKFILPNLSIRNPKRAKNMDKNKYVIKIPSVGGGEGVFIGSRLSENKFYSIINDYLESNDNIILQQKATLGLADIFDLQTFKIIKAAITLDPFVINNPNKNPSLYVSGFSSRAIDKKCLNPSTKFNPETNRPDIKFGAVLGHK